MPTLTDPARELADICTRLSSHSDKVGSAFLSEQFNVPQWSTEFFQIIFLFSKRADELIAILPELSIDADYKEEFSTHIRGIQQAFSPNGLNNQWTHSLQSYINPANVNSVKALSGVVRPIYAYPKLSETEQAEVVAEVDELLEWLTTHQLRERDFIRQAIIDGVMQFRFRLERIGWLGWGYTLDSLRDVIGAYLALEKGTPDLQSAPDAEAVLRKTAAWAKQVFDKVGGVREAAGDVAFMVLAYEQVVKVAQGKAGIAGLLTFAGS